MHRALRCEFWGGGLGLFNSQSRHVNKCSLVCPLNSIREVACSGQVDLTWACEYSDQFRFSHALGSSTEILVHAGTSHGMPIGLYFGSYLCQTCDKSRHPRYYGECQRILSESTLCYDLHVRPESKSSRVSRHMGSDEDRASSDDIFFVS